MAPTADQVLRWLPSYRAHPLARPSVASLGPMVLAFVLGTAELLIILAVVVLVFGGAKLPELARSLGAAKREFEAGSAEASNDRERSPSDPTS